MKKSKQLTEKATKDTLSTLASKYEVLNLFVQVQPKSKKLEPLPTVKEAMDGTPRVEEISEDRTLATVVPSPATSNRNDHSADNTTSYHPPPRKLRTATYLPDSEPRNIPDGMSPFSELI
jgi:hypothetical protein